MALAKPSGFLGGDLDADRSEVGCIEATSEQHSGPHVHVETLAPRHWGGR